MIRKIRIPDIVSNIKISSHNKDIINISFSILEIFQSCLRGIQINGNQKVNQATIEKENTKNISVIKKIFL